MNENFNKKFNEIERSYRNEKNLQEKFKIFKTNFYYLDRIDQQKTLWFIEDLISQAKSIKDARMEHIFYLYKFNFYRNQGEYTKALKLALKSKDYFFTIDEQATYFVVLSDIAAILLDLGLMNQAIYLWKEIFSYSNGIENNALKYMVLNNLISTSIINFQIFENTEAFIAEMISYYEKNDMQNSIMYCKSNAIMGLYVMVHKKQPKEAKYYLDISLQKADELKEINTQFELYELLAKYYDLVNDNKNKLSYLKKALHVFSDNKKLVKAIPVIKELYQYYKSKDDFKNALKYYQLLHNLEQVKFEHEKEVTNILNQIGFDSDINILKEVHDQYIKKHIFDFNRELFLENIKGDLTKVNIESIINVKACSKMIKIHFVDKTHFVFKVNLKEFWDMISDKFGNDHLFFYTNLRNEIVNLSWMSKYDKLNKNLYINVLGEETVFKLTRGQSLLLKDYFKH